MTQILKTGARVSRVDEEGEVELFLYSLGRSFTFTVGYSERKAWGGRLGDFLTVQVLDEKYDPSPEPSSETHEEKKT